MVVLDTCAIIELCKTKPTLSVKTIHLIEQQALILSISFAEIACKLKTGKLEMDLSASDLHMQYSNLTHIDIVNIGVEEWFESIELAWPDNKDPADRIITSFAIKKKIPIVTSDNKIKRFYKKVIW